LPLNPVKVVDTKSDEESENKQQKPQVKNNKNNKNVEEDSDVEQPFSFNVQKSSSHVKSSLVAGSKKGNNKLVVGAKHPSKPVSQPVKPVQPAVQQKSEDDEDSEDKKRNIIPIRN